jgi:hypothetical protein
MNAHITKIQIALETGHPEQTNREYTHATLEEKVRDILLMIDAGGHDAHTEWEYIKKLYRKLQTSKQSPRVVNLREMIEPVLAKYGHHKVV